MPATRRTSHKLPSRSGQSRLSFGTNNKVTKPTVSANQDLKKGKSHQAKTKESVVEIPNASGENSDEDKVESAEVAVREQAEVEVKKVVEMPEHAEAKKISDAQLKRYWKRMEDERKAPRVHQQDLNVNEKILRLFDLSSQYGPCIGIARLKRWNRAYNLGLNPPKEVLAILLKEEAKGNPKVERAYINVADYMMKRKRSSVATASAAVPQTPVPIPEPHHLKQSRNGVPNKKSSNKASKATEVPTPEETQDPESGPDEDVGTVEELQQALSRKPAVNSSYLPLPWEGRLGYACLCTYLRYAKPPVFSSRTCRIASILEQRHPLKDPSEPAHAIKNRPDRDQPADHARGQAYVESLGLANARDIVKMLRWNDKYGIRFFRLSSEMFPFASHEVYGYKLAPFAADALAEAGRVAAELGHRLTTHPGQFTQLGSPRKEVIEASIRDLEFHSELLSLLKLPPQQNRDAVMILHMGGVYGDKAATLDRFRENYKRLSKDIKARLVLENDDVSWTVHDLLPICKELNIPMVLDYHHNNILHSEEIREGTLDIMGLYDEIIQTWKRKKITPKMHYSEPTPSAITPRQRRKHSPRVATLPPCPPDMDLMIEAKDKEQAVFELMRAFRLPGFERINNLLPHIRVDENKPEKPLTAKQKKAKTEDMDPDTVKQILPEEEISMGGPEGRVYWPPGMEEWLRPAKRVVKPKPASNGKLEVVKVESDEAAEHANGKAKSNPKSGARPKNSRKKMLASPTDTDNESTVKESETLTDNARKHKRRRSGRAKKVDYSEDVQ
ncbi:MAG: UV-damage endonuclease [Sarcosagium campestre]|nr:MAG: UV-damage endonuclease [Sarcosagium campestre]